MKCWHLFYGDIPIDARLLKELQQAGIDIVKLQPKSVNGPGILFFGKVAPELYEFISGASYRDGQRIIAINTAPVPLSDKETWRLLHCGASDVIEWRHASNPAGHIALRLKRWSEVDRLMESRNVSDEIIGKSPAWRAALKQIVEVAHFTDAPVLVTGESGTGKELTARLIHDLSPERSDKKFVILDCTNIVPELSGSEFFGHEKGAFTGAYTSRDGAFALANGGTLFLDEVGDLPLGLQAQLLRVIQEKTFKRVGGNTWYSTDFRLVCATNKDLSLSVALGKFRQDLYYRITGWSFKLPPLRERTVDIEHLANHFIKQLCNGNPFPVPDEAVRNYLIKRQYSGNIRDLKQLIGRIMSRYAGSGNITAGDIPEEERPVDGIEHVSWCDEHFESAIHRALSLGVGLKEIGRTAEDTAIRFAVDMQEGSAKRAADMLNVSDRTIQLRYPALKEKTPINGDLNE